MQYNGHVWRFLLQAIFTFSVIWLASCDQPAPNGGGCIHIPPEVGVHGAETFLELKLTVWGKADTKIDDRYTDVICYYRKAREPSFHALEMRMVRKEQKEIVFSCALPSINQQEIDTIEYFFTFKFDGVANKKGDETSPFKILLK